jgi:hypothetical protein
MERDGKIAGSRFSWGCGDKKSGEVARNGVMIALVQPGSAPDIAA